MSALLLLTTVFPSPFPPSPPLILPPPLHGTCRHGQGSGGIAQRRAIGGRLLSRPPPRSMPPCTPMSSCRLRLRRRRRHCRRLRPSSEKMQATNFVRRQVASSDEAEDFCREVKEESSKRVCREREETRARDVKEVFKSQWSCCELRVVTME